MNARSFVADFIHVVFCVDPGVLPGLHVAAFSLLASLNTNTTIPRFYIFSKGLNTVDQELLHKTLKGSGKSFELSFRLLDTSSLSDYPPLNGSLAAYYRLLAAEVMDVDRFLYLDADTLCDLDLTELNSLEMGGLPAAWVPEAPLAKAVDRPLAIQLGNSPDEPYFNSGVLLVNVPAWRRQRISRRAIEYVANNRPIYHDQSALNFVLHRNSLVMDSKFNCLTNMRKNWPSLMPPSGKIGKLLHFLDSPKPWNYLGEWVHPQYHLWRAVLDRTAIRTYRSWTRSPSRKVPANRKALRGYQKLVKDRVLFAGYSMGWLRKIKGIEERKAA